MSIVTLTPQIPLATQEVAGGVLYIADKPWIDWRTGQTTQCSLDLRHYYDDRTKGFVTRLVRTDKQVTLLAQQWAAQQTAGE